MTIFHESYSKMIVCGAGGTGGKARLRACQAMKIGAPTINAGNINIGNINTVIGNGMSEFSHAWN